jgi:serine/threonine protein phosphatase 1
MEELYTEPPLVVQYPLNTLGRDFIVGDIHGAYTLLLTAMQRVNFDAKKDRLFCVGDLIDRGEESARVAKFLSMPYVHAVRGNHEDMLLKLYKNGEPGENVVNYMARHNGFGWWLNTNKEQKEVILTAIKNLPIVIEVATSRGQVGIVHAEVPHSLNWQDFLLLIEIGEKEATGTALWGRKRIQNNDQNGVLGIDRVFVGHTPQWDGAKRFGNVYAVDTGAIFADLEIKEGAKLTIVNLMHTTVDLLNPEKGSLLNILNKPVEKPFGQYTKN